jgi:hypothetical protein
MADVIFFAERQELSPAIMEMIANIPKLQLRNIRPVLFIIKIGCYFFLPAV